jgi:primase-polymerase (primpol)-like protein
MTMTGNVYNSRHIENCQNKLDTLFNSLGKSDKIIQLADEEQHYSDTELFEIAYNAENGQKFYDLYNGHWQDYYSSQSEADHALINILSYFSRNQEQIARMFRASALGKRQKAMRDDYVGKMIRRSFDNYIPPVDIGAMAENVKNVLVDAEQQKAGNLNLQLLTPAEMFPTQIAPIDAPFK